MQAVVEEARRGVTPTREEVSRLENTSRKVLEKVRQAASSFDEVRAIEVGGSFAKGTWLPGGVDIDIFVKISTSVGEARFELVGLAVGREAARGYPYGKKYAQHPYTEATVDGVQVNIVPCYDVKPGHWRSAADRSPYHVEFVKRHLDQRKRTEVRLLKRFMKAVSVYGAEIEREGFSGYAAEVLIHLHGTFEKTIEYFANLKPVGEAFFTLRDPVDEERELSKAISKESVARMVLASRSFLRNPQRAFFERVRPRVRRNLRKRVYALRFDHKELSEDTLWGELKKSARQLTKYIEGLGFTVSRTTACSNNRDASAILILPETESLADLEERTGPGVELASEVERFVGRNAERSELVWAAEDGRLHVLQKRGRTELADLLSGVRSEIVKIGASREMARAIARNGRILRGPSLEGAASREPWLEEGIDWIVADSIGTD